MATVAAVAAMVPESRGHGAVAGVQAVSPPLTPPANGPRRADLSVHAIVGATVHVAPGQTVENATVVMSGGRIEAVIAGGAEKPPAAAQVWDAAGLHVYAGFIEPYVEVDAPAPDRNKAGVHWSAKVTPQRRAIEGPGIDAGTSKSLRSLGFTAAAMSPRGGIFRGSADVVSLAEPESEATNERPPVYREMVYHSVGLEGGGFGGGGDNSRWDSYPNSQMGVIALIRQTLIDAEERMGQQQTGDAGRARETSCLDSLTRPDNRLDDQRIPSRSLMRNEKGELYSIWELPLVPMVFSIGDELEVLRVAKIAAEFKREIAVLGCGTEFRRLDAIAAAKVPIIVPLSFTRRPGVASIGDAESVELRDLMTWEQAPTNPRRLAEAGVQIAFTTAKLRDRNQFRENLRSAIRHGLSEDAALAALTTTPAKMLGVAGDLSTIEAGKRANLIVADGPIFAKKTKIRDVWVDGKRHEITAAPVKIDGVYDVTLEPPPKVAGQIRLVIDKDNGVTVKKTPVEDPKDAKAEDVKAGPPAAAGAEPKPEANATAERKPADEPQADAKPDVALQAGAEKGDAKPGERGERGRKPREQTSKAKNVAVSADRLSFVFDHEPFGAPGVFTMSGVVEPKSTPRKFSGEGRRADGEPFRWTAVRTGDVDEPAKKKPLAGRYRMSLMDGQPQDPAAAQTGVIVIGEDKSVTVEAMGKSAVATEVKIEGDEVAYTVDMEKFGGKGLVKVSAKRETAAGGKPGEGDAGKQEQAKPETGKTGAAQAKPDALRGTMITPDGASHTFEAARLADDEDDEPKPDVPAKLPGYPFGPYAFETLPAQGDIVFEHATIWTCAPGSTGPIADGSIRIKDGKILWVSDNSKAGSFKVDPTTKVVDAKGKHISPGIIDCHSHTGISGGVNESGQAVTAEVRIGDVTDPDAMNWYRQLAGGTTAVNNLHGSANPIGGQNQVNKIRWGVKHPDEMHFEGAIAGIKFALGENVKGGNSSGREGGGWRYPQTRMGVETLIRDRFLAAREYLEAWRAAMRTTAKKTSGLDLARLGTLEKLYVNDPPSKLRSAADSWGQRDSQFHRDLELEALAEILAGERLIHCHSYRQDEILMLGRLAQEFGFRIGTYQHILEGYKVAEVVRESGGGSGFSDWWAYKVEVQDAIPQGFPIMHEAGAVVSFNSDSDELARRLNVEAGKAVKYSDGRIADEEALKFVTLNPAKQLQVDGRVGSLEAGKDADLVIWSGPPISSLSRCEATYVDGRMLFSLEQDKAMREVNAKERQRLIQKILADAKKRPTPGGEGAEARPEGGPAGGRPGGPGGGGGGRRRPPQDDAMSGAADEADSPRSGRLLGRMLDDAFVYRREKYLDMLRRGINPADARGGECGCEELR